MLPENVDLNVTLTSKQLARLDVLLLRASAELLDGKKSAQDVTDAGLFFILSAACAEAAIKVQRKEKLRAKFREMSSEEVGAHLRERPQDRILP